MSDITWTFKPLKVSTDPSIQNYENFITSIWWKFTFTDGVRTSVALGNTRLDYEDSSAFIAIEDITDATLESWVISAMGANWPEMIFNHTLDLENKAYEASLNVHLVDQEYLDLFADEEFANLLSV